MIVTSNCDTGAITITSDLISDYIDESPTFPSTLTIETTVNGGATVTSTLSIDDFDLQALSYTLDADDGVYSFKLKKQLDNTLEVEEKCFFHSCSTQCEVITCLADGKSDIWKYFQALNYMEGCELCTCEKGVVLWNKIQSYLTDNKCSC